MGAAGRGRWRRSPAAGRRESWRRVVRGLADREREEALAEAVEAFYVTLLEREADAAGRANWLATTGRRDDCTQVALALLASDEFSQITNSSTAISVTC